MPRAMNSKRQRVIHIPEVQDLISIYKEDIWIAHDTFMYLARKELEGKNVDEAWEENLQHYNSLVEKLSKYTTPNRLSTDREYLKILAADGIAKEELQCLHFIAVRANAFPTTAEEQAFNKQKQVWIQSILQVQRQMGVSEKQFFSNHKDFEEQSTITQVIERLPIPCAIRMRRQKALEKVMKHPFMWIAYLPVGVKQIIMDVLFIKERAPDCTVGFICKKWRR